MKGRVESLFCPVCGFITYGCVINCPRCGSHLEFLKDLLGKISKKAVKSLDREVYHKVIDKCLENYGFAVEVNRYPRLIYSLVHEESVVERLCRDPVFFCCLLLGFKPSSYQAELLQDEARRQTVRWCRQSGKTYTLGAKSLWFTLFGYMNYWGPRGRYENPVALVVSPSLRQSIIFRDKMKPHVKRLMRKPLARLFIDRALRQTIYLSNGGKIVALPNSPDLIRGETAHIIFADEAAMFRDDEYLFEQVLEPMLATTNGFMVLSSTPKGKKSYFYKACQGDLRDSYREHWVSWRPAVEEKILSREFIDKRLRAVEVGQLLEAKFTMEYEARFVEDTDSWLPIDLITQCIDSRRRVNYYPFDGWHRGVFYLGVDLGQKVDHTVVMVVEMRREGLSLVFKREFPLETPYASVIGFLKVLQDRFKGVQKVLVDITRERYVAEDMVNAGIKNVEGVVFSRPVKESIMGYLKQVMVNQKMWVETHRGVDEHGPFEIPYDDELIDQLNAEKYEYTKGGNIRFSHPSGTHDDQLWALALAVYAAREPEKPGGVVIHVG